MDLVKLLTDLQNAIESLKSQLADAQAAADALAKAKYDEGFAAGVASVVVDPSKKYSEEELQAAISSAVLPLQEEINKLVADQLAAIESAKAMLKADIKQALDALEEAKLV